MAEKELRKMNRTELIEIIYAMQQNDRVLRQENEELQRQLNDRTIRIEQSGSIAEAALSLNHIFEDAEAAAKQYLESIRTANEPSPDGQMEHILDALKKEDRPAQGEDRKGSDGSPEDFQQEKDRLLEDARRECARLLEEAQLERAQLLKEAQRERTQLLEETQQECSRLREDASKQAQNKMDALNREIRLLTNKYPMLRDYLARELKTGGDST